MSKQCLPTGLLLLLLVAGCVSERVVLLPSPDGRPSSVVVRDGHGELILDHAYAGTIRRMGSNQPDQTTPDEVKVRFSDVLAAQPARPTSYMLYFESGGKVLTEASRASLAKIHSEVAKRAAPEITVIGHTDRVGDEKSNEILSKQRAELVRAWLIEGGVAVKELEAVGRGEREPLVPTADGIAEPKNRRVEINLR